MNIDRDKLIEMAKEAGFKVNNFTVGGKEHFEICAIGTTCKVELDKFASLVSAHAITSMQPSEALNERNKLGYAVVDVIGKLDEINGHAQECELDDITQIAIPLEIWNELQEALENMPTRAESFTSMQTEQEPVALIALKSAEFQKRIAVLEDLLASAYNIANRNGENTHWQRFAGQLHINGISPVTPKTFKILPSDDEYSQLSTNTDGWVRVSDRLPEERLPVLIRVTCSDYFNIEEGQYWGSGEWINCWFSSRNKNLYPVTHWMPLPAISQDKGESV